MKVCLGVDVACRAAHQASLADEQGRMLFVGHRFRTDPDELDALWARLPGDLEQVEVVMEPTRNAWVALAAWFRRRGAKVVLVPPEQSADLRDYYNSTPRPTGSTQKCLPAFRFSIPRGCIARTRWARGTISNGRSRSAPAWCIAAPPRWPASTRCWRSWGRRGLPRSARI